ncbi:MAG: DUF1385 domain-containing protein [Firmicutes bacterium]|nr:DUF1385 domain-containing protein [Bacillota bacterium]
MPKNNQPEYFGGQALIEGVMMQGTQGYAMASRTPDGRIVYKTGKRKSIKSRHKLLTLPLIRGVVSFAESMYVGFSSLTWSAFQAGEEEEDKLTWQDMVLAIGMALVLTAVFFVILPVFLASFTLDYLGPFGRSLIEGLIRVALFLGYVVAIRQIPDVARVFEYHGAEHKTINAWEAGLPLTVENIQKQSRINCRCGTSFIVMSLIMMVLIFTFVGNTSVIGRIITKLVAMPVVMGVAYEVFRLPLKYPDNPIVKILIAPGLQLQRLTTKEPDAREIEVAMAALLKVPAFPGAADNELPPKMIDELTLQAEQAAKNKAKDNLNNNVNNENTILTTEGI